MGHVDTYAQTGVSNQITIKPRIDAGDIKDDIMIALNRSWISPEKTDVTARDGKVTLTGTVDYWDVRAFAGTTAWAAPRCHLGDARYPRLLKIRKPQQIRCRRAFTRAVTARGAHRARNNWSNECALRTARFQKN